MALNKSWRTGNVFITSVAFNTLCISSHQSKPTSGQFTN